MTPDRKKQKENEFCSYCDNPAVFRKENSSERLCSTHFTADLENRVRKYIRDTNLISPGDHIALALSGGKDSTALLLILNLLLPELPDVTITAITIDEGITGYREETILSACTLTSQLGIRHRIVSFTDIFGTDLDTLLKGREKKACTICGVLRRRALEKTAREIHATKLATGHNQDDEAQSVLMNVLRGDLVRLVQDSSSKDSIGFIPRIKPLSVIREKEVVTYLYLRDHFIDLPECPYTASALRSEVRNMLTELEYRHPGVSESLINSRDSIRRCYNPSVPVQSLRKCRKCGDLCRNDICQVCRIIPSP